MKILAHLHGYPPVHNAGAEYAAHALLTWLSARGHDVTVFASLRATPGVVDGVKVVMHLINARLIKLYQDADIVLTHLDETGRAMFLAKQTGKPLVHYVHNDAQLAHHGVTPRSAALCVMNAQWIAETLNWRGPQCVVTPPILPARYRVKTPGTGVLLANMNENKGAATFWALAERLPHVPFVGVKGAYGVQEIPSVLPPNVTILGPTSDMREVFARTRVVLMPSAYESWGRVAMEAAVSGIPTICHPTPGLRECLGDAGIYVDRADTDGYAAAIERLLKPRVYATAAKKARARYETWAAQSTAEMETCEAMMQAIVDARVKHPEPPDVHLPAPVVFRCTQYPQLNVGNLPGVKFVDGVFRTTSLRIATALRETELPIEEVK